MLIALSLAAAMVTCLCCLLLPPATRNRRPSVLLATALAAYVAMRVGAESGVADFVDHEVLEPFGAEIDDVQTWVFGGMGALLALAGRRRPAASPGDTSNGQVADES